MVQAEVALLPRLRCVGDQLRPSDRGHARGMRQLLEAGSDVLAIDREAFDLPGASELPGTLEVVAQDVRDSAALRELVAGCQGSRPPGGAPDLRLRGAAP